MCHQSKEHLITAHISQRLHRPQPETCSALQIPHHISIKHAMSLLFSSKKSAEKHHSADEDEVDIYVDSIAKGVFLSVWLEVASVAATGGLIHGADSSRVLFFASCSSFSFISSRFSVSRVRHHPAVKEARRNANKTHGVNVSFQGDAIRSGHIDKDCIIKVSVMEHAESSSDAAPPADAKAEKKRMKLQIKEQKEKEKAERKAAKKAEKEQKEADRKRKKLAKKALKLLDSAPTQSSTSRKSSGLSNIYSITAPAMALAPLTALPDTPAGDAQADSAQPQETLASAEDEQAKAEEHKQRLQKLAEARRRAKTLELDALQEAFAILDDVIDQHITLRRASSDPGMNRAVHLDDGDGDDEHDETRDSPDSFDAEEKDETSSEEHEEDDSDTEGARLAKNAHYDGDDW
jgi:hypothetical protein